jgi:hypothetical protein
MSRDSLLCTPGLTETINNIKQPLRYFEKYLK